MQMRHHAGRDQKRQGQKRQHRHKDRAGSGIGLTQGTVQWCLAKGRFDGRCGVAGHMGHHLMGDHLAHAVRQVVEVALDHIGLQQKGR